MGIALSDKVLFVWNVAGIGLPVVGTKDLDGQAVEHRHEPLADIVPTRAKGIGENLLDLGSPNIPQPALVLFAAHIRPLLVHFAEKPYLYSPLPLLDPLDDGVDLWRREFFKTAITVVLLTPRTRAVSFTPDPFIAISTIFS